MPEEKVTPEQAQLQLQLYDLRREAKLRLARDWFFARYFADSMEEGNKLTPPGSDENAYMRMVVSYWEQACALMNHGALNRELFFELNGEFFAVWERMKKVVPQFREQFRMPTFLAHMEKAAQGYEGWMNKRAPGHLEMMREWTQQMREAATKG
jgi:hypothetical protein